MKTLFVALSLITISFAAVAAEGSDDNNRHFSPTLRLSSVQFTGHRVFRKYYEELLHKKKVSGTGAWVRMNLFFNPKPILYPVFGMGVGLMNFTGEATRKYQDGEEFTVKTVGSYIENGFILGFRPGLSWMFLFCEFAFGLSLGEKITIDAPVGKKTFKDEERDLLTRINLGAKFDLWRGLFVDASGSFGLMETDDSAYSLGAGYAF